MAEATANNWQQALLRGARVLTGVDEPDGPVEDSYGDFPISDSQGSTRPTWNQWDSKRDLLVAAFRRAHGAIALVSHAEGAIMVVHNFTVAGGNVEQPELEIGALLGTDEHATPVNLGQQATWGKDVSRAPTADDILDADDDALLEFEDRDRSAFTMKVLVLVPPSLMEAVLKVQDRQPSTVLQAVRQAVADSEAQDESSEGGSPAVEGGQPTPIRSLGCVQQLVRWLWCQAKDDDSYHYLDMAPSQIDSLRAHAADCHRRHITGGLNGGQQSPQGGGAMAIAASAQALTAATAEVASAVNTLDRSYNTQKSKTSGLGALSDLIKEGLLNMSAYYTGNTLNRSLTGTLTNFYASGSAANAAVVLESYLLRSTGHPTNTRGMSTMIYCGGLAYPADGPGGLTLFACHEATTSVATTLSQCVPFVLAAGNGGELSAAQQKYLSKQTHLKVPATVDDAARQLQIGRAVYTFCFGRHSPATVLVSDWARHVEECRQEYLSLASAPFFYALIAAIDDALQAYWRSCLIKSDFEDVDVDLLDMSHEMKQIGRKRNPFADTGSARSIPSSLLGQLDAEDSDASSDEGIGQRRKRRQRTQQRSSNKKNRQAGAVANADEADYGDVHSGDRRFRDKYGSNCEHYNNRPKVGTVKFCTPFHLGLKRCGRGNDCPFHKSHKTPSASEVTAIKQYVQLCNGNRN